MPMRKLWMLVVCLLMVTAAAAQNRDKETTGLFKRRYLPTYYVDQVTNFFSQHRWAKGKELLDESLELYPNDPNLHYLAGRYWWNGKNYDKARYHLVKACQLNYHFQDAKTLLVNVEEITGNYSSAVCYVNELLELNPYWKGLWLRKVDLYKKMGNFEEANALLQRLSQIYPSDVTISGDYFDVLETIYVQARRSGNITNSESALKEIVRLTPGDIDYQLAYANILIQQGKNAEALESLNYALSISPGNVLLVRKAADVLMSEGKSVSAIELVRNQLALTNSPELRRLYDDLLTESARMEDEADPYSLYTRVYSTTRDSEALQYLLNNSVKKGYYDDALYYIAETRRLRGDSPRWYMLEYEVYSRMGRQDSAMHALENGLVRYPSDYDINVAACRQRLSSAGEEMKEGSYAQAIPLLEFVRRNAADPELRASAVRRLAVCYRETSQMDQAEQMLRERLKTDPEYMVTVDYASLLVKQGRPEAALQAIQASYSDAQDSVALRTLGNAYKETAYPYIKERLANGAVTGLQPITDMILDIDPNDYWGLRYSLRTADDPLPYAYRGIQLYPDDLTFPIKAASILAEQGRHERALNLLRGYLEEFPADDDLQRSYAAISDSVGNKLYKEKNYDRAQSVLDSALAVRPLDPGLRYTRGLLYEKRHQWDSAYVYQRNYKPSLLEEAEFKAHMNALRSRTLHNTVDVGVDVFRFTDRYQLMGLATVGYTHFWENDELSLRINYTGRDSDFDETELMYNSVGGQGLQFQGGWMHNFGSLLSLRGTASVSNAFFPRCTADLQAEWHLPRDWDMETTLSYRLMRDRSSMYSLGVGGFHTWENMYAGGKVTAGLLHSVMFYNAQGRFRFYPIDGGRSYIEAQAGAGTAPELTFLNYYYSADIYNNLNSFVSLTGSWALAYNLTFQLSGTWNTIYDQRTTVTYRNMFLVHASVAISF